MTWDSLLQSDDSIGAWLSETKGIFPVFLFVLSSHFNEQTLLLSLQNKEIHFTKYLLLWFDFIYFWPCWGFVAACRRSPAVVCRLLTAVASLVAEHRLSSCVHGFSCPAACGIFPD